MRFSIITVCFNAADSIEKTIESLIKQDFEDYEYIIKDGGSRDNTVELARNVLEKAGKTATILTAPDKGIFDAMNQAVEAAAGEYIYFLNSGDLFSDEKVLEQVSRHIEDSKAARKADIVFGNVYECFADASQPEKTHTILRKYGLRNTRKWYYALGACLNHQTMFCRKELFADRLFDLDFRSNADRDWQMYHILEKKCRVSYIDYAIAIYLRGGFSEQNLALLEAETLSCVKKYCGGWIFLHNIIRMIKKSSLLHRLLTRIEAKINVE